MTWYVEHLISLNNGLQCWDQIDRRQITRIRSTDEPFTEPTGANGRESYETEDDARFVMSLIQRDLPNERLQVAQR